MLVNVGVEWREEKSELLPDAAFQSGDGAGQGGPTPPISGGYTAKDLFAEARMALIEDAPFAQSVSAEAGYRYSDYSLDFTTDTYKLGLEWTPIAGHPRAGELSARGACAERRGAVRCANGRPRRHDRRVRRIERRRCHSSSARVPA